MAQMEFVFWYWWVLAFLFLILEMLTPGFFFMWLAVSGLITGLIVWLFPALSLNIQVFIFSVFSVLAVTAWRLYGKKYPVESDQPLLNKRGAQYIGRVFSLYTPIENGQGKIKVDDTLWKVHGEDCDIHTKVKVTGIRGTVFDVEKVG
ncbi:NfeD family protein [Methyloglobulus sp.]|uniref:NfeD family protein n=1 Tax=Methyloglobulus sp. TaxID=2518622 RepID=UPI00398A1052